MQSNLLCKKTERKQEERSKDRCISKNNTTSKNERRNRGNSMKYKCDYCGEEFYRSPNQVKRKHKFCSRECSITYRKEHHYGISRTGATTLARRKLKNIVALKKMFGDING